MERHTKKGRLRECYSSNQQPGQSKGEGVKKSQNFVYLLHGCPTFLVKNHYVQVPISKCISRFLTPTVSHSERNNRRVCTKHAYYGCCETTPNVHH